MFTNVIMDCEKNLTYLMSAQSFITPKLLLMNLAKHGHTMSLPDFRRIIYHAISAIVFATIDEAETVLQQRTWHAWHAVPLLVMDYRKCSWDDTMWVWCVRRMMQSDEFRIRTEVTSSIDDSVVLKFPFIDFNNKKKHKITSTRQFLRWNTKNDIRSYSTHNKSKFSRWFVLMYSR